MGGIGSLAYVPCLKARENELKALAKAPTSLELTPLFELQRASAGAVDPDTGERKRSKSTTTDASYFIDDIARLWDAEIYVDISRVADGRREEWWSLLHSVNAVAATPAQLIPVLIPDESPTAVRAASLCADVTSRLAVRVHMPTFGPNPSRLAGILGQFAANSDVAKIDIDLILDWSNVQESHSLDALQAMTKNVMTALGDEHGQTVVLGTPNDSQFVQVGDWVVTRREWWLWLRLAHAGEDVVFGDYALYSPADPAPVAPRYGHLRYSSGDSLHVHRRAVPRTGGGLGAAFTLCCKHLVGQPHWLGASHDGADGRMQDIANGSDKESQPGIWRQMAVQHHLTLVSEQLSAPPSAPTAGTP